MKIQLFYVNLTCKVALTITLLLATICLDAQVQLPAGVKHFPESLGPLADTGFYNKCLPMFSSINWENDASGNDRNIFILTLSRISSPLDTDQSVYKRKIYPSQAMLLQASEAGVFPRWEYNYMDDTVPEPMRKPLGILRYYPEYGIYALMKQDARIENRGTLIILDSTFHKIDAIPGAVANSHDFQLLKMPNGNWEIITALAAPPKYFEVKDKNYQISAMVYDHNIFKRQLWKCGPTVQTVDSAEWYPIYNDCLALPARAFSRHDMFHVNSWQAYNWAKDSILVAISEKNANKVRFWWIVDSSGRWYTRNMFRLGCEKDKYNNFSFPDDPDFHISGGHNFRIIGRYENTLIASYYDDEECDTAIPARGLILQLDVENKICRILQQCTENSHSEGQGNVNVMLDQNSPVSPESVLHANRCMDWGGWNKFYTGITSGYYPSGADNSKRWEISVINPKCQAIVGITMTDLGYYTHYQVVSDAEYQAQAFYTLPLPESPITYKIIGDSVMFFTKLTNPTWITGAKTRSIILPLRRKNQPPVTVWVRGKTDETMFGELWENISLPTK